MPETLFLHPDMTDEEWARWETYLLELSKSTNLGPFCSGISNEQPNGSFVPPYGYDALKTNADDHRTRTAEPTTPEMQVERSGASSCSLLFLQRLNKDGTIHSEIECKDYGLFNALSLKRSPLQIIGAYQAILGDAFEAGFDLNCHPEDFFLRTSESNGIC